MWRGLSEGTATAVPSRPTTYTRESQSHEGSAWPLQCGVYALHTVFLFRLSPKVAKNPGILSINKPLLLHAPVADKRRNRLEHCYRLLARWQSSPRSSHAGCDKAAAHLGDPTRHVLDHSDLAWPSCLSWRDGQEGRE